MTAKTSCWEFFKCGRELGGAKAGELGVCPAATDLGAKGLNSGKNGGRICWAIAGTFCGGTVQGTMAEKEVICSACDFFKQVKSEEDVGTFTFLRPGQEFKPSKRKANNAFELPADTSGQKH